MAEWVVFGILAGFAAYDVKWKKVKVTAVGIFGAVVVLYRLCIGTEVPELLLGMVPGIALLLVSVTTNESIGTGDGVVLCVLGLFCGMKPVLAVLGMAFLLCTCMAILLLVCKRANKKTELPFLPCLCSGYLLYLMW